MSSNRTLDEVRDTILAMPFAKAMQLEIESCGNDAAVISIPLSDATRYSDHAFGAPAVATAADMAAAAASLASLPPNQMAVTTRIDVQVTASTRGARLSSCAVLRDRAGPSLVFDVEVRCRRPDGTTRTCGHGVLTPAT